jgi:fructose-1,6-bisphosphatase I
MPGNRPTLRSYLSDWAHDDQTHNAIADTVHGIANCTVAISELIRDGSLVAELGEVVGSNVDGDTQKSLDVRANELLCAALRRVPVGVFGSEEEDEALLLNADAPLAVAVDPLDGSSNIDTNISIGTIFSILPALNTSAFDPTASLLQAGVNQLAAGFVIYGPQTAFALTVGQGVDIFVLDCKTSEFVLARPKVQIPAGKCEYAINASNYRYWDRPVRAYVDDCIAGDNRPNGDNFNMRWVASLVAEAYRILARGGVFLYPRDSRPGYQMGRLRHIYEANPIALLVEQAGGAATDGERRMLEIEPSTVHARVPFVFGSSDHVARVARYQTEPRFDGDAPPLFRRRGLFQN